MYSPPIITGLFGYPQNRERRPQLQSTKTEHNIHLLTTTPFFRVRTVQVYDSQPHLRQSTLRIFYDTLARLAGAFLSWLSRKCEGVCVKAQSRLSRVGQRRQGSNHRVERRSNRQPHRRVNCLPHRCARRK